MSDLIATLAPGQHSTEIRVVDLEPLLVDERTAAKLLGCCARTVFSLNDSGKLPCVKLGSRKLYRVATLEAFVRDCESNHESEVAE